MKPEPQVMRITIEVFSAVQNEMHDYRNSNDIDLADGYWSFKKAVEQFKKENERWEKAKD